jgi:hypothetical protein|tara:strand:+ start:162 stop:320 length:159 start_codon:yes stop_codon:yes gene_type:complete
MSWASKYIERQIKKKGLKGFIIWVLDLVAKATPSKKDDKLIADIKKAMRAMK